MNIDNIYNIVDSFSSLINCGECNLCEGESVYLMPWELEKFTSKHEAVIVQHSNAKYLSHQDGNCQFFDTSKSCANCNVYMDRPFCCRLYPLGIFDDNGVPKWGVYKHCPRIQEISPVVFEMYASMLEKELDISDCKYLWEEDAGGSLIEGLKGNGRFHKGKSRFHEVKCVAKRGDKV